MHRFLCFLALQCSAFALSGQQTVGVFVNAPEAYPGYTLFTPSAAHSTYLIDNCGRLIHQWPSQFTPGQSVYLMTDGSILRTARINSTFLGGGSGGRIENISWDGETVWAFDYSSPDYHQHHDIAPMPNGNILVLAWERKSREEAIAVGCDPAAISPLGIWPDHIVELKPMGSEDAEIVWEWYVWDHLVQDFDSTKPSYGNIADHPAKININYPVPKFIDWLHCNSIDYHPQLDQILISVHSFNEVWIIDHSTTTEEAAGSTGGNSGRGGDLLYRWGNAHAYDKGTPEERRFDGQHDAKWVEAGVPGERQISVFNNNHGQDMYSSADFFQPDVDSTGQYHLRDDGTYGPDSLVWSYDGMPDNTFYSARLSGVQRLSNGNTLICSGNLGRFIEVTVSGMIVWDYISPLSADNAVSQGSNPVLNDVFRAERYPPDHEAFQGRDLMPGLPLELNPLPLICHDSISHADGPRTPRTVFLMPNPVTKTAYLLNPNRQTLSIDIFAGGQLIDRYRNISFPQVEFHTEFWPQGLIVVVCTDVDTMEVTATKLLKL